jgi:hypothetical protein
MPDLRDLVEAFDWDHEDPPLAEILPYLEIDSRGNPSQQSEHTASAYAFFCAKEAAAEERRLNAEHDLKNHQIYLVTKRKTVDQAVDDHCHAVWLEAYNELEALLTKENGGKKPSIKRVEAEVEADQDYLAAREQGRAQLLDLCGDPKLDELQLAFAVATRRKLFYTGLCRAIMRMDQQLQTLSQIRIQEMRMG